MNFIKECVSQNRECIEEALRFGNREKMEILKKSKDFAIGLEFEFHVSEGVGAFSDEDMPEAVKTFINSYARNIESLSQDVAAIVRVDRNTITSLMDELIDTAEEGDPTVVDSVFEYEFDQAAMWCDLFANIIYQSKQLQSSGYADSIRGMGVWDGDESVENDIKYFKNHQNSIVIMDDDEKIILLLRTASILRSILDYLDRDTNMVKSANANIISTEINRLMRVLFVELNPEVSLTGNSTTKIDIALENLPLPRDWVANVVPDVTVEDGAEVITKPLSISQIEDTLHMMSDYIKEIGSTSQKTGLHVNISLKSGFSRVNVAKVITLLDPEFFQGLSPSSKEKFKYRPRFMVGNAFDRVSLDDLNRLASVYVYKSNEDFVKAYESMLLDKSDKLSGINLENFFFAKKASERRIEFRFFGGYGYERRSDEIYNDILNVMYAIFTATDESFRRKEYLSTISRQLNRVVARKIPGKSFDHLIDQHRKNRL